MPLRRTSRAHDHRVRIYRFAFVPTGIAPHPHDRRVPVSSACRWRPGILVLMLVGALWAGDVLAHEPSAWGGLFRSRDAGGTWLHLTPGSFGSGAMALAVSPVDPNHLMLATDSGVS